MASSGSWYSLTELCCDTWRQQKNSLEKKTDEIFHIKLVKVCVYVCVCTGQERKWTFTSRSQRAAPELGFLVLQLALQVLRGNLSRLH